MPRGDRTGPNGAGAMSGRRMGFCVGNDVPGFHNQEANYRSGDGFGFRHRFGGRNQQFESGYGYRRFRGLFPSEPINKKSALGDQIKNLKDQLEELENQFKNLK